MVMDMSGLLIASLLERMRGIGQILNITEHEHMQVDIPKYLNYPECILKMGQNYPWTRIDVQEDESMCLHFFLISDYDKELLSQDTSEAGIKKLERTVNRVEAIKKLRSY